MLRVTTLFALSLIAFSSTAAADGTQPALGDGLETHFGFSGIHAMDAGIFDAMSEVERRALFDTRNALVPELGAKVLRTGSVSPHHLRVLDDEVDWAVLDHRIGSLTAGGIHVVLTLSDLPQSGDASAYRARLSELLERYDGDGDFGVEQIDLNAAFPDINGSGSITNDDWEASDADKLAWAEAHQIRRIEIGERVRALEDATSSPDSDYSEHLASLMTVAEGDDGGLSLMLGSVWIHEDSQQRFVDRLSGLDADQRASLGSVSALVGHEIGSLDVRDARINLEKFEGWLEGAGLEPSERWLGGLSIPSGVSDMGCEDARCSERTQVASLVRLVVSAVRAGYTHLLYERPIEVIGQGISEDLWSTTGLVVLEVVAGLDVTTLPLKPRPAYPVWRRLQEIFEPLRADDLSGLHDLPQGVEGAALPEGWILWFDWHEFASPGAAYDNEQRPVVLTGIETPSLKVVSFWPDEVGGQLDEQEGVSVSWAETYVPVIDGSAQVIVGQDPLWVLPSMQPVEAESAPDEEVATVPDAPPTAPDAVADEEVPPDQDDNAPLEGGCRSGKLPIGGGLILAASMAAIAVRRRRLKAWPASWR